MKFSILGFSQEEVLSLRRTETKDGGEKEKVVRIDVIDLLILSDIADFMNRKGIIKYIIDEKTYFSVKYATIMQDLPILGIKQQALADRLDKLCSFNLLEKAIVKSQSGSYTAFRIGDNYETIAYKADDYSTKMKICSHSYQNTSAKVAEYECHIYNIDSNNNINPSTINHNKESNTNVLPKKNDYQAIFDCWNKHNGKKIGKVTQFTDKRKKAVKRQLDAHGISEDTLMKFFATLPYADKWLYNPSDNHKTWKPTFDWWMSNPKNWLTKGLEGGVHLENPQVFNNIMNGESSLGGQQYTPQGHNVYYDELRGFYYYTGFYMFSNDIMDGYTDEERPDGAKLCLNNARGVIQWNANRKEWIKL